MFGIKGMLIAAAISAVAASWGGWKVRDAFCDAAALRVQLQMEQDRRAQVEQDLKAAVEMAKFNERATKWIEAAASEREERIRALEKELKSIPAADRCPITPSRLKRLRGLR